MLNSRDLCLLDHLPGLIEAGIDSLKIEGRMKSMGYVGAVVRIYRAALDWIWQQSQAGVDLSQQQLPDNFHGEMLKVGTRGWTENFFDSPPGAADMMHDTMRIEQPWAPVGIVRQPNPLLVEARNVLESGDSVEYLGKQLNTIPVTVTQMRLENGQEITRANPGNRFFLTTEPPLESPELLAIIRKKLS